MSASYVRATVPPMQLEGDLRVPQNARGMVIFAHGSGSSRFSPRNQAVAEALVEAGFATFLLDLLDRKSTRLNSSHITISYAVFCLKKKKKKAIIILNNKKKQKKPYNT